jgi:outer membrane immunogenic protein
MKKFLLATTCLALTSTVSMAADMGVPYTKAPMMAAPVFSWTGCYIGAHVGGGTMTSNLEGQGTNGTGAVAGGQAGCNYQDGNWVFGLEGEGYWSGIRINNNGSEIINPVFNNGPETFRETLKNTDDFTIAARVGMAFDRTLIYGKGGWAWGAFKDDRFNVCCSVNSTPETFSTHGTLDGPMFGVGIEHALTRNWTVKFEYDFIAFSNKELSNFNCVGTVCGVTGTSSFSMTKQIFKVGANYLFDIGGAPLVAKY